MNKEEELKAKLKEVWNDEDFVLGNLLWMKTDEERDKLISFINSKKWKTTDDIEWFIIKEIKKLVK